MSGFNDHIRCAGIIAAGAGSRLGPITGTLKPLVKVGGKPLAHWITEGLRKAGIDRIVILLNSTGGPVREYLERGFPDLAWTFLSEDTASSWESFRIVSRYLANETEMFLISTVDALIPAPDVRRFAREALAPCAQGAIPAASLALTRFVEDEKPLWADLNESGKVEALGAGARRRDAATCGLYALTRETAALLPAQRAYARLRDFWMDMVKNGNAVRGVLLGDAVDVDRPEDLAAAEKVTACFDA